MRLDVAVNPSLWPSEDERELWRVKCYESLWWMGMIACGALDYMDANPKDKGTLTDKVHKPFVEWFQKHLEEWLDWRSKGIKRRKKICDVLPRFFRKTWWNRVVDLWCHLHDPDMSTALGSVDTDLAAAFLDGRKAVAFGDDPFAKFAWLYGSWLNKGRSIMRMKATHGARHDMARQDPSWFVYSIKSGLVGTHPDITILDDPIDQQKLNEEANWIDTVNSAVDGFRPAMRTDGLFIITMTRYHLDDPVGHFLPKEGVREWLGDPIPETLTYKDGSKVQVTEDGEWNVYYLSAFDDNDESICPEIISTKELRDFEKSNPIFCASQYRNNPVYGEHTMLTAKQVEECFISKDLLPEGFFKNAIYVFLNDTAFKSVDNIGRGDSSVNIVVAFDPRMNGDVVYIEGYGHNRYRTEDFTEEEVLRIQEYQKEHKRIAWITCEKAGKSDSWPLLLEGYCRDKRIFCPPIKEFQRAGGKKKWHRIRLTAGYWTNGHVKLLRGAPGVDTLVSQMLAGEYGKHDDWADAFADIFNPEIYQMASFKSAAEEEAPIPISPGDDIITGLGTMTSRRRRQFRNESENGFFDTIPDEAFQ